MSWSEVFKINSNMKKPLNEQIRESRFLPIRIITTTGTYTPEKTGLYKVVCVGAGGNAYTESGVYYFTPGGGGGVAVKTLRLVSTTSYNVTVNGTASFAYESTALTATSGGNGSSGKLGTGGTASGGDANFPGTTGAKSTSDSVPNTAGGVGVHISELPTRDMFSTYAKGDINTLVKYGDNILGYGGGGASIYYSSSVFYKQTGLPAAVIIIPLEMEA